MTIAASSGNDASPEGPTQVGKTTYDILILGGGPGGAVTAVRAARNGAKVLLLEQSRHPRFHIGESLLPPSLEVLRDLGLQGGLSRLPHVPKFGGSFVLGHQQDPVNFHFEDALHEANAETFNIARSFLDAFLIDAAREAGAEIREHASVSRIVKLDDSGATVEYRNEIGELNTVSARFLVDASGHSTLVGRHLGTRRRIDDHKKVAYYGHFKNVERRDGRLGGYPITVFCHEGWFWLIPLDAETTSIGLVMDAAVARQVDVPPHQLLAWGIARCPFVAHATRDALCPPTNHAVGDFSYTCAPYSGPGFFMVGDAATFIDPIFSTGVSLAMKSGIQAADSMTAMLDGRLAAATARRDYNRFVTGSSQALFELVRLSYDHACRELLLQGEGPFRIHKAIISLLTARVFPRPRFGVRWRTRLFTWIVRVQARMPRVPEQEIHSLVHGEVAVPGTAT